MVDDVYLDERGHEVLDGTPVAIPVKFQRPPSLAEQVRSLVRGAISQQAAEQGYETFEEADDFNVGDDFDPASPYEMDFDTESFSYSLEDARREAFAAYPEEVANSGDGRSAVAAAQRSEHAGTAAPVYDRGGASDPAGGVPKPQAGGRSGSTP